MFSCLALDRHFLSLTAAPALESCLRALDVSIWSPVAPHTAPYLETPILSSLLAVSCWSLFWTPTCFYRIYTWQDPSSCTMKITSQVAHNTSAKDSPEEGNLGSHDSRDSRHLGPTSVIPWWLFMPLQKLVNTKRLNIKGMEWQLRMPVRFSRDGSKATVGNRTKMVGSLGVKGSKEVQSMKGEN